MENVSSELKYATHKIENAYDFDFIPGCSKNHSYLTEGDLELTIDTLDKRISASKTLFDAIGLGWDSQVIRVTPDPELLPG